MRHIYNEIKETNAKTKYVLVPCPFPKMYSFPHCFCKPLLKLFLYYNQMVDDRRHWGTHCGISCEFPSLHLGLQCPRGTD